jgi:hypothetical protein
VVDDERRFRASRLSDPSDLALLAAASRGQFAPAGFRNCDLRALTHLAEFGAPSDEFGE